MMMMMMSISSSRRHNNNNEDDHEDDEEIPNDDELDMNVEAEEEEEDDNDDNVEEEDDGLMVVESSYMPKLYTRYSYCRTMIYSSKMLLCWLLLLLLLLLAVGDYWLRGTMLPSSLSAVPSPPESPMASSSTTSSSFVPLMILNNNTCPVLRFQAFVPPAEATAAAPAAATTPLEYASLMNLIQSHRIRRCHVRRPHGDSGESAATAAAATVVEDDWNVVVEQEPEEMNEEPCACARNDPTQAAPLTSALSKSWDYARQRNIKLLQQAVASASAAAAGAGNEDATISTTTSPLDVLLLGDSITEHWLGTDMGVPQMVWQSSHAVYLEYFQPSKMTKEPDNDNNNDDAAVHGLALGIGGDRCAQLLYRLQQGEMPVATTENDNENPPFWNQLTAIWVTIGTNDLGGDHCSVEAVVSGIIAVVEEILQRLTLAETHSTAAATGAADFPTIVINSVLPRGVHHKQQYHADPSFLSNSSILHLPGSYWNEIQQINQHLLCYTQEKMQTQQQQQEQQQTNASPVMAVEFFNATALFLMHNDDENDNNNNESGPRLNATLYADAVHPSAEGYRVWGRAMLQKVQELRREKQTSSSAAAAAVAASPPGDDDAAPAAAASSTTPVGDGTMEEDASQQQAPVPEEGGNSIPPPLTASSSELTTVPTLCHRIEETGTAAAEVEVDDNAFLDYISSTPEHRCRTTASATGTATIKPCACPDPRIPNATAIYPGWDEASQRNQQLLEPYLLQQQQLDVLLLGDSLTEFWLGSSVGKVLPRLQDNHQAFLESFRGMDVDDHEDDNDNANKISALPLGIAGDYSVQLLYRIQEQGGELPVALNVSVIWMTIGTNDLLQDCNANAIAAGNIAIVHEIRQRQPHAHIVINSLLPRKEVQLWAVLQNVNVQLQCWVDSQQDQNVEFFNATELFVRPDNGQWNPDLFADPVHPNGNGYRVWGKAIAERVQAILDNGHS